MRRKKTTLVNICAVTPAGKQIRKTVDFVADHCRHFHNAQHLLLQLERGERAFYDYLCEHMDAGNLITIDRNLRKDFVEFVERVSSKKITYSEASVTQYTLKLNSLGLILREEEGNSGFYMVNPKYVFSGTETVRKSVLKETIEAKIYSGATLQHLISRPESEFLT